ncbi:MAG: SGNH/GDSL hydrolase family protein [Spirochaetaceae bacterium]|nr:SGNH/GDSL hydrolase family protein [Spirochaetaceae bacterium]
MQKLSKQKKTAFSFVFLFIIILFFMGMEGVLRLIDYGDNYTPFLIKQNIPDYFVDNQSFISKYHPAGKIVSTTAKNFFPVSRTKQSLRGFVIGGSTAQGYPYPANQSFSKILETALSASGHYDQVSVVNLGFSAMSSFYVKDAVAKIMDYNPDFIVVYTGHNEFYGTISGTTGKSYFFKNLYMALKEIKLFQMLFKLSTLKKRPEGVQENLMAQQFRNNQISADSEINNIAGKFFRKNIQALIDVTSRGGVPVFFIEPVSNLIDMPPFLSQTDIDDEKLFSLLYNAYNHSDSAALEQLLINNGSQIENSTSAHISYLTGLIKMKLDQKDFLPYFIRAKDLDAAPFRGRTSLIRELTEQDSLSRENVHFIPLSKILIQNFGPEILSNRIFIDHLHFNMEGQKIVGRILAEEVGSFFSFTVEEKRRMASLMDNEEILSEKLHLTEFFQVFPYWSVSSIIAGPPYTEMKIPFNLPGIAQVYPENELAKKTDLHKEMFSRVKNTNDIILFMYDYYLKNEFEKCLPFINSLIFNYPGTPAGYVLLGDYLTIFETTENNINSVISSYYKALYLSGFEYNIYSKLKKYLEENNKIEILNNLNYEYKRQL